MIDRVGLTKRAALLVAVAIALLPRTAEAEMRAPAHFMDHHCFDFDGAISIVAPIG